MNKILQFIKKLFTYNHCDTCGFTKDAVYVTEYFLEAGIIQCEKCVLKNNGSQNEHGDYK
jgi:hypothetical protein